MSDSAKSYSEKRLEDGFEAYVLFSDPYVIRTPDLVAALNKECGGVATWEVADQNGKKAEIGPVVAVEGDDRTLVFIVSLSVPVPADHYADNVRRAITFPGAQKALDAHSSHVMITAKSRGTDRAARYKAARIVTCVAAMIARSKACTAVLFPTGDIIAEPTAWQEALRTVLRDAWPFEHWISFDMQRFAPTTVGGKPEVSCASIGMAAFNGHEVSFAAAPVAPIDAYKQVFGAIYLLLQSGSVFTDGEAIGVDGDGQKLHLRYAPEGFLGFETDTWVILHPKCPVDEEKFFAPAALVPPPAPDAPDQQHENFLVRLLRQARLVD